MLLLLSLAPEALAADRALLHAWRQLQEEAGQAQLQEVVVQLAGSHLAWCSGLFRAEAHSLEVRHCLLEVAV